MNPKSELIKENIRMIVYYSGKLTVDNFCSEANNISDCINSSFGAYDFDFDVCEYIIETYDNGNKSHAREFFNELPFSTSRMIAFDLGSNGRNDIYSFITN